jgi:hypothetical protein
MAVSQRIVLFHDSPPHGRGHAEVFEPGIGLIRGVVALPHARKRLRLDDPQRVMHLVRRFAPDLCVPLDPFDRVDVDGERIDCAPRTRRLERDGRVTLAGVPA